MQARRTAEDARGKGALRPAPWLASYTRLALAFWAWKVLLLLVAVASPGPGYDTSTAILLDRRDAVRPDAWLQHCVHVIVAKLTRWDAVYFTTSAARGHLFEQEWAFSRPVAKLTSVIATALPASLCPSSTLSHALAGILISHSSHFFAVLLLYQLTHTLLPCSTDRKRQIAFTAACLHTVSPAGLFLSSFNGEASFALFNFLGFSAYVASTRAVEASARSALYAILAGVAFGIAAMIRSNGLLSGLILALDAITFIPKLGAIFRQHAWHELVRLAGILLGGLIIALAYVLPQVEAFVEYCTNGNTRPWCTKALPSIYTWVQSHYWGVGFLRYWTLSNLPLFAIALPMITILIGTSWVALSKTELASTVNRINVKDSYGRHSKAGDMSTFSHAMARLALPQLVLAIAASTNFHVQIINRISSGYPTWYIVLAVAMHLDRSDMKTGTFLHWLRGNAKLIVQTSVMYAIVQGGLYASFLPPA